eukprot:COSAG05_NODE_2691_length_2766_cov_3.328084_2_plen_137_part_00
MVGTEAFCTRGRGHRHSDFAGIFAGGWLKRVFLFDQRVGERLAPRAPQYDLVVDAGACNARSAWRTDQYIYGGARVGGWDRSVICDTYNRADLRARGSSSKTESVRHDIVADMGQVRRREASKHHGLKGRAVAGGG